MPSNSRRRNRQNHKQRSHQRRSSSRVRRGGAFAPYDVTSSVDPYLQWDSPFTSAPAPEHNAGLYTGPDFQGPHGNIYVPPTTPAMTNGNLRSADPPLDALTQYVGSNRPGNNYRAVPGISWYSDPVGTLKHNILCNSAVGGGRSSRRRQSRQSRKSNENIRLRISQRRRR